MPVRLVVTDIDGTLTTSERRISEGVRGAVRAAQARGVRVCLATGRAWKSGRRYVEGLGADPPAILFNGAMVYDFARDRILFQRTLDRPPARRVIDALDAFPDLAAHLYIGDRIYVRWWTPLVEATAIQDHLDPEPIGDLRTALVADPLKFRILGPRRQLEALEAVLADGGPTNTVYSEYESLEVLPPGVSKGEALRVMAGHLRVPLDEILAIGNDLNDLAMIRTAGLGVAMANAPDALREAADYVAPSNDEDGLAEVLRRFVLGEGG